MIWMFKIEALWFGIYWGVCMHRPQFWSEWQCASLLGRKHDKVDNFCSLPQKMTSRCRYNKVIHDQVFFMCLSNKTHRIFFEYSWKFFNNFFNYYIRVNIKFFSKHIISTLFKSFLKSFNFFYDIGYNVLDLFLSTSYSLKPFQTFSHVPII